MEPIREADPEISVLSARIVIQGVVAEQNDDPRPRGPETRRLHRPKRVEVGEATWNPSGSQIPGYPRFRPGSV